MKFFFDNCVSRHLAEIVAILEGKGAHEFCALIERFEPDTPDSKWLPALSAEKGWVIITADERLRRGSVEKAVWKGSSVVTFFLSKGWVNHGKYDQAWRFVKWWPLIMKQAKLAAPGSAYEVSENVTGKFKPL